MFSCQLKFVIDLIKKWPAKKYFCRYKEHDLFSKQIQDGKPHWLQQNKLHNLWFLPSHRSFKLSKWKNNNFFILDFVIEKEHSFTRNIFHYDELKPSRNIETLEKYGESVKKKMLRIVVLLHTSYSKESKVEDISDDCIIDFSLNMVLTVLKMYT